MKLVIEFGDGKAGYGSIHKAGCKDVQDPEMIGTFATETEALDGADQLTGWDNGDDYHFANCVKFTS